MLAKHWFPSPGLHGACDFPDRALAPVGVLRSAPAAGSGLGSHLARMATAVVGAVTGMSALRARIGGLRRP
eukprot:2314809-Amphidinium_carterae.1